ncbi:hypothetical protein ACFLVM_02570, partial [Chloroflexota bacterium]
LWVSRLYRMVDKDKLKKKDYLPSIGRFLFLWAKAYANREAICELSDTPTDTTSFDKGLRELGLPVTIGKSTVTFHRDRSFYIDTLDDKLLQQMEQMKKDGVK